MSKTKKLIDKRLYLIFCMLTVVMSVVWILAGNDITAHAETINGFVIENGVLKEYKGNSVIVNVPDGVQEIDKDAFKNKKESIEQVVLPDSVKTIDAYTFQNCTSLTTITFSYRITDIGTAAFKGCTKLQSIDLSKTKLEVLRKDMFSGCTSLTDVVLPESIKVLSSGCFDACKHLGRINLPEGLEDIQEAGFRGCDSLSSIDLPDTLVHLGNQAFDHCYSLSSIRIPAGITVLPEFLFYADASLENVYLPDTIKVINKNALITDHTDLFGGEGSLDSIYLPDSITYIDENNLDRWCGTETIYGMDNNVVSTFAHMAIARTDSRATRTPRTQETYPIEFKVMEKDAKISFDGCGGNLDQEEKQGIVGQMYGYLPTPKLKDHQFAGWYSDKGYNKRVKTTTLITSKQVTLYAKWEKYEETEETYSGKSSDFTIKNGVLKEYTGSEAVVIVPDTVTEIGISAFKDNTSVRKIVLPESVSVIDNYAFSGCINLTELNIPEGVTVIPRNMCMECHSLKSIVIPEGVTEIGEDAFSVNKGLKQVVLPGTLKTIDKMAFNNCSCLTEIILPDGLESIGEFCFDGCESLQELRIPESVTILPRGLCSNCYSLKNLIMSDSVTEIGKNIIQKNRIMKELYISKNAAVIDDDALANTDLTALTIVGVKSGEAYNYYEGLITSKRLGNDFTVKFEQVKEAAVISFDTKSETIACEDRSSYVGLPYGTLPQISIDGKDFIGWSTDGTVANCVSSDDLIDEKEVTLHAVWKDSVKPADGEPVVYQDESGTGNDTTVIEISTPKGLSDIRNNLAGHYKLTADIDLSEATKAGGALDVSGYGFCPIGAREKTAEDADGTQTDWTSDEFTGVLDGNGHTIKGLRINGETPYKDVGLFARIEGGQVSNITFKDTDIEVGTASVRVGALAGYVNENPDTAKPAVISNITTNGKIYMTAGKEIVAQNIALGGVIGYFGNASLTNAINYADVFYYTNEQEKPDGSCSRFIAGVAGYLDNGGIIEKCSNHGTVSAYRTFEGIFDDGNAGDVVEKATMGTSDYLVSGGIVGVARESGKIDQCYNTGDIRSMMDNVHTLFSLNITSTYNSISGGIVGTLYKNTSVINCYNTGDIKSGSHSETSLMSGMDKDNLITSILAMLDEITVSAPVDSMARSYAAGIVGYSTDIASGPVKYCYNTGRLNGDIGDSDLRVYGIANGKVPVAYCRFAEMTATLEDSNGDEKVYALTGSPNGDTLSTSMPVATDKLTLQDSYRGFDFNSVWFMVDDNAEGNTPMLYANTKGAVNNVEITGEPVKKAYKYGEALDLTGVSVKYQLASMEEPATVDLSGSGSTNYNPYKTGEQIITLEYFGVTKDITVTVGEVTYILTVENGVIVNEDGSTLTNSYCNAGDVFNIKADTAKDYTRFDQWIVVQGDADIEDPKAMTTTVTAKSVDSVVAAEYVSGDKVNVINGKIVELNGRSLGEGVDSGFFAIGDVIKLRADDPEEGRQFDKWKSSKGNNGNTASEDLTLTEMEYTVENTGATFEAMYKDADADGDDEGTTPGGDEGTTPGGDEGTTPGGDDGTTPGGTTPGETTPGGTTPGETTPGGTTPGGATGENTTGGNTTGGSTTGGSTTGGSTAGGSTSGGSTTGGTTTGGSTADSNKVTVPTVSKVKSFKAVAGAKRLVLTWKKLSDISGYEIEYSTSKKFKKAKAINVKSTKKSYTLKKLKANKKYYVRIRAYKTYTAADKSTKKAYGKWVKLNKKTK